jgi:hypothetical protein
MRQGTIVVIALLFFLIAAGNYYKKRNSMTDMTIKMPFPAKPGLCDYDPAKIHFSQEYNFLVNIYSPLLEYSVDGKLVSAVAEKFEWIGTDAHFTIRPDLRTIDGTPITVEDVEASFKRLFVLSSNTHGDLKDMVCQGKELKKLSDLCPGMSVLPEQRKLVLHFPVRKIFLFQMLTSIDFSIIPRSSFDKKTLKITDYRNTSGPYYVKTDNGEGNIELAANPAHFHYSEKMPQAVMLVPVNARDVDATLKLFDGGKINHIGTFRFPSDKLLAYAAQKKDVSVHSTYPNRLFWFSFTKKGRLNFSVKERFALGKAIKTWMFNKVSSRPGYEAAEQLFPALGDGALTKEHLAQLRKTFRDAPESILINRPVVVWAWNMSKEDLDFIKRMLPAAKFVTDMLKLPGTVDYKKEGIEEPEICFLSGDTSPQEDISFFSYYLNFEFLHIYGEEGKTWLRGYMATEDRKKRLAMAEELHFKTLINGEVIPMAANTYAAIAKKPWAFNYSKFYATNFVWRITRN